MRMNVLRQPIPVHVVVFLDAQPFVVILMVAMTVAVLLATKCLQMESPVSVSMNIIPIPIPYFLHYYQHYLEFQKGQPSSVWSEKNDTFVYILRY